MIGKGNCCDNAAFETFFKAVKTKLIWRRSRETRRQAETTFGHSFGPMAVMTAPKALSLVALARQLYMAWSSKGTLHRSGAQIIALPNDYVKFISLK